MTEGGAAGRPAAKWMGPDGPDARLLSVIVAIAILVLASIVVFVVAWISEQRAGAVRTWQRRLEMVAEDRQIAVAGWIRDLVSDARTAPAFPTVGEAAVGSEAGRRLSPDADEHLREILKTYIEAEELAGLLVFDGQGEPVASAGVPDEWERKRNGEWANPGPDRTRVQFVSGRDGRPLVAVSMARATRSAGDVHIIVLADPSRWLFPFLGRALLSSRCEAILVASEAGRTVLLSPSRLHPSKLLEPMADTEWDQGAFAATRKVPGTDWTLVVRVDRDEALARVRQETLEVVVLVVLGVLLVTSLTFGLYRETRRRFRKQAEASAQRLALLLDEANDAILSVDARGRLVDVNRKAEELWGRSREELLSLTIRDLEPSGERPALDRQLEEVRKGGHRVFETEYVRKDGSRVPVEVSTCSTTVEGGPGYLAIVRDLSARKEGERLYRLISENSVDVIWTFDIASMRFTYISPSVTRLRGFTPKEVMAQPLEAAVTPESAVLVRTVLKEHLAALAMGADLCSSLCVRVDQPRKDGSMVTTETVARVLMDSHGRPAEILGATRDIGEHLAAEEEIRESREALIETQRIAHVGSWERDLATGALTWSDEVYRIFGLDPSGPRIDPERFLSLIHPEDRDMLSGLPHMVRTGGGTSNVDYRIVRPDGTERVVHSLAEKVRDGDGTLVRVRGSIADVTDRKRQEERLVRLNRELEELASTARELSRARDLASVTQIVGRAARTLKEADGAAVNLREGGACCCADEDAVGSLWKGQRFPVNECICGWVMERGQAAAVEDVRTDPRVHAESYAKTFVRSMLVVPVGRPDAIAAIAMCWASPRRADAEDVRFAQALADTTAVAIENVQLYADLDRRVSERTAQLEQANREMAAFSYSVSHDLRAPLRAIDGFSSMLEQRSGAVLGDEGKRLLGVVRTNTRKMATLIDGLLAFSRVGRSEMRSGRVDMETLARAAFEEVVSDAAVRNRISLEVGSLAHARGDSSLLRLVWSNLLGNAVKFSSGRDRPVIRISGEVVENHAVYKISDNGVGFDMAYAAKLFGVFQRLHGMSEFEGTGIGLALVHRIVTRHGGNVSAVGAVGEGATFTFSLPAA